MRVEDYALAVFPQNQTDCAKRWQRYFTDVPKALA